MSEYPVSYFHPNQIVFFIAGPPDSTLNQDLMDWANGKLPSGVKITKLNPPVQFPPPPPENPDIKLAARVAGVYAQEGPYIPPKFEKPTVFRLLSAEVSGLKVDEPDQLLNIIFDLDDKRIGAPGDRTLQAVSPNWLVGGGASSPGSTGGPGSRPDSYDGQPVTRDHEFDLSHLPPEIYTQVASGQQGARVSVAILDTAPLQTLEEIKKDWVIAKQHSLLSRLLKPGDERLIEIVPDGEVDTPVQFVGPNPPEYLQSNDGHDYLMADHGLFAAGIINSLAPGAEIRLFQVLNRYGVGDLTSIARGLQRVLYYYPDGNKLLVNMSLTINFPLEEAHITTDDPTGKKVGQMILSRKRSGWIEAICTIYNWLCMIIEKILPIRLPRCEPSWYERQVWAMEGICDSLDVLGSKVIAAAGNRRRSVTRPQAEYPAAFPSVLGVGALKKYSEPPADPNIPLETAEYSNFSDQPQGSGIATLGGEKGKENGVLGIYLGEVPPPEGSIASPTPSTSGWAWWAGTSFATPIVTGIMAAMLSNGGTHQQVLEELRRKRLYRTKQEEEALFVKQCEPQHPLAAR